jgi:hypothetical protein
MDERQTTGWHCLELSSGDIVRGSHAALLAQFETFFVAMEAPSGMAMFTTGLIGTNAYLYFSPATARWAQAFLTKIRATPCEPPSHPLAQLAGDPGAFEKMVAKSL